MRFAKLTIGLLLALASAGTVSADNRQPIQIEADRLTVEEDSGISTYSGNVAVSQGLLNLRAETVEIHSADDEITRIIATVPESAAQPARFEQLSDGRRERVEGEARRIIYHVREDRLELLGKAMLSQADETTVSGDAVNYDASAGRVNATSSESDRVRTTIRQNPDREQ